MLHKPAFPGALYSEIKQFPKNPKAGDLKKEWYIYFHYLQNGTWHPVRKKGDINRIDTFKEKVKELHALKKAMALAMDRGWNPVTKCFAPNASETKVAFKQNMTISEALDFALENADLAPKTKSDYKGCVNRVKTAVSSLGLSYMPIQQARRGDFKLIIEKARILNRWSDFSFNKNLGYLQGVLSHLLEYDIIEYNPAHRISKRVVPEGKPKYVPYTQAEKKKIFDYLFLHHYGFSVYFMTCYYTGMRPMEVLALKLSDIDFTNTVITIVPDKKRRNSKTKKTRVIQINQHLLPLLREWVKDVNNQSCFLFGSPYESGRGNKGSSKGRGSDGAFHPEYFKPSLTRIKRDTVTRLWKKVVIDKLGIKKHQYAGKHTSADDMLLAGISLEAIKDLFGHSDAFMTKRYQTVLQKLHRAEINQKAPAFIPAPDSTE